MIFYRAVDQDGLVHWLTVATEAKAIDRNFQQHDIETDKASMKAMLNDFQKQLYEISRSRPAEGTEVPAEQEPGSKANGQANSKPPARHSESYAEKSVRFEDEFDAMPLTQQLHFAARAMENARDHLPGYTNREGTDPLP